MDFALVSVSFHFLNVIKDLEWDVLQGIQGAPQRLGKRGSVATAAILVLAAVLLGIVRPS